MPNGWSALTSAGVTLYHLHGSVCSPWLRCHLGSSTVIIVTKSPSAFHMRASVFDRWNEPFPTHVDCRPSCDLLPDEHALVLQTAGRYLLDVLHCWRSYKVWHPLQHGEVYKSSGPNPECVRKSPWVKHWPAAPPRLSTQSDPVGERKGALSTKLLDGALFPSPANIFPALSPVFCSAQSSGCFLIPEKMGKETLCYLMNNNHQPAYSSVPSTQHALQPPPSPSYFFQRLACQASQGLNFL